MPGLFGFLEANQDPDAQGRAVGNFFATMMRRIQEPPPEGANPIAHMLGQLIGPDLAARAAREAEIKTFFMARLAEGSMPEAVRITKERYQLPDDYSIEIPLRVSFKLPVAAKASEPDVD